MPNAGDAQQSQWRGGGADQKVEIQIDQRPEAVLRAAGAALGMLDDDLAGVACKSVCQRRDVGAALVAAEYRIDDVAAIGPQHAAVVTDIDAAELAHKSIHQTRGRDAEHRVLTFAAHAAHDIAATLYRFEQLRDLFGRILQIRIERHDDIAARGRKAGADRGVLSVIAVQ